MKTQSQTSSGGIPYRDRDGTIEVALIAVGDPPRWQLPKGQIDPGESPEETAVREVREETGIEAEIVAPLERIEYWYVAGKGERRVRFHKFVHFYLMRFRGGDVADHDHEVREARWVPLDEASRMLAFPSERRVLAQAAAILRPDR